MNKIELDVDNIKNQLSDNIKYLAQKKDLTQKELAACLGVAEPSLSGYINKNNTPSFKFLLSLKAFFGYSIDEFLYEDIKALDRNSLRENVSRDQYYSIEDLNKYVNTYFIYYSNTQNKSQTEDLTSNDDSILKYGLLRVLKPCGINELQCEALFSYENITELLIKKDMINKWSDSESMKEHFDDTYFKDLLLYTGKLTITQQHIFINLSQNNKKQDFVLIALHRPVSNRIKYIGGLGTMTSTTSGNNSDPVVQFVALSQNMLLLQKEKINKYLTLSTLKLDTNLKDVTDQIVNIAKSIYVEEEQYKFLDERNKKAIITSNLEYLLQNIVQKNVLQFSRISLEREKEFYKNELAKINPKLNR